MTTTLAKPRTELFQVEALWEWTPASHEDLGLIKGDVLSVFEEIDEHWARGRNIKTHRRGKFPLNHTRSITETPLYGAAGEGDNSKALVLQEPPAETTNNALQVRSNLQDLQTYAPPAQPAPWNPSSQLYQAPHQMLPAAVTGQPQALAPQYPQSPYPMNLYPGIQPQFQQWPGAIFTGGAPVVIGSNNILGNQYQADVSTYNKHDGYDSVSYSDQNEEYNDWSDHRHEVNDDHRSYSDNHRSYSDKHRSYNRNHRENHEHRRSNTYSHHGDHIDQGDRQYGNGRSGRYGGGRQSRYKD